MRGYSKSKDAERLRHDAAFAIGNRLRAEYERVVSADVPPEFRDLIARLDQQSGNERKRQA